MANFATSAGASVGQEPPDHQSDADGRRDQRCAAPSRRRSPAPVRHAPRRMAANIYAGVGTNEVSHPLLQKRSKAARTAVIVLTTEKGLCGPAQHQSPARSPPPTTTRARSTSASEKKGRQVLTRLKKDLLADFRVEGQPHLRREQDDQPVSYSRIRGGGVRHHRDLLQPLRQHPLAGAHPFPRWCPSAPTPSPPPRHAARPSTTRWRIPSRTAGSATLVSYISSRTPPKRSAKLLPYYIHLSFTRRSRVARLEHSARRSP